MEIRTEVIEAPTIEFVVLQKLFPLSISIKAHSTILTEQFVFLSLIKVWSVRKDSSRLQDKLKEVSIRGRQKNGEKSKID